MAESDLELPEIKKPVFTVRWIRIAYQILFVISVGLNVALSALRIIDSEKVSKLGACPRNR